MSPAPVVSVVMAAYNGAALLPETLKSLAAQSFADFEVIVVDDRSTDATRALIAGWPDPRIRLIALPENGGPVRARNRGVAEAHGRYIAALDQDDLCLPDRFARQVALLDANPGTVLVGTAADMLYEGVVSPSTYAPVTTAQLMAWLTWIENPIVWSTVMLRTAAARTLDPFTRPEMLYAEDFDLYHRIQPLGAIERIDTPLLHYRQHAGGASQRFTATMQASATRVLAERHAGVLGADAAHVAQLLVAHNMLRLPVPSRAALSALGAGLATLQAAFFEQVACDAEDVRLIRWETARRWGRIGRAALRSGALGLADVMAVRPDHLGLGYTGADTLMWSGLIGGARRLAGRAQGVRTRPS